MKLFLSSTGLPEPVRPDFLRLLGKDPGQCSVAFIPTASEPDGDNPWYTAKSRDELKELGFRVTDLDLKAHTPESLAVELPKYDVVYVGGGNTFYLLDWVRKSGFDRVIRRALEEGAVYVGGSAGAILAGPSIELALWDPSWDTNDVGLENFTGLGLVPFVVSPHYQPGHLPVLASYAPNAPYAVVSLNDNQAIAVDGGRVELAGPDRIVEFNGTDYFGRESK